MSVPNLFDNVLETSTTTGTGSFTLAGAVTGYFTFATFVADGQEVTYVAADVDVNGNRAGAVEVGRGVLSAGGTVLSRAIILSSSNAGAAVSFAAGTRRIGLTYAAAYAVTSAAGRTSSDSPLFSGLGVGGRAAFKGPDPFVDVMAEGFTRLCSASLTATTGTIANGSNSLALAAAIDFQNKHGIWIVLDNGTIFRSYIVSGAGTTTVILNDNAPSAATAKTCSHDDTLAFQDAINFASSSAQVYIPGGNYYLWNITIPTGISLQGAGPTSTTLVAIPGNTSGGVISLATTATSSVRLRDFLISGNKSATPAPTCAGIYLNNSGLAFRRHQLANIRLNNCAGAAIKLEAVLYSNFTDITIDSPDGHGIVDDAASFFNKYLNVEIYSPGLNGLHLLGDASFFTNFAGYAAGRITPTAPYGANIYIGSGSHGHTFAGFWVGEGALANINIDAGAGGSLNMTGTSHQNNAAEHLRITGGTDCRIVLTGVPGVSQLATCLVNLLGSAVRNYIDFIYNTNVLAVNAQPVIGAGVQGNDNYLRIINGSKLGSGDINVYDCEPLLVTSDWTRNAPSTLWRGLGAVVVRQPS